MEYVSLGSTCAVSNYIKEYNTNRYPFDWCNINIKQLNSVLLNDFDKYTDIEYFKESYNHPLISSIDNSPKESIIVKNKYNVSFAHEIAKRYEIDEFKSKLHKRIQQFKKLENPYFIRFENSKFKSYYNDEVNILINYLDKHFDNYKLIFIVPDSYKLDYHNTYYYKSNYIDWKYENIFNDSLPI